MKLFSKIKENPLLSVLIFLLILLAVGFVVVMFFESKWIFDQLGIRKKEKNKALTFLGIGMGGIMAALDSAQLQGAGRVQWSYGESFEDRIQMQIGKETDLSGVIFAGGLSQKDVDFLVEDLSEEKANELRKKLEPHIGKPISNELPKNSGADTGTYTKKDAKKWIDDYKKAMSEIPGDDS